MTKDRLAALKAVSTALSMPTDPAAGRCTADTTMLIRNLDFPPFFVIMIYKKVYVLCFSSN